MSHALLSLAIEIERDVVLARQRARRIAELLGFEPQDQTRIATAVSEIARNAFAYARRGVSSGCSSWRRRIENGVMKPLIIANGH